jgi:hypothetical protein
MNGLIWTARTLLLLAVSPLAAFAQIRVDPTGVNVNAHSATTVFLTFGGLGDYVPVEAVWCGSLLPAAPDIGSRCDPATIYGRLPIRYDRSRASGAAAFTDIMSVPASVARRAYQAAEQGEISSFFYVRRFVSASGGPDQYVAVTCRLTGGGARTPLALTDVRLSFGGEDVPVLVLQPGQPPPPLTAEIAYNGSGRLQGRWEVVLPGEELPAPRDLLTEATLPHEERSTQRRYTSIERFNVFLPPTGRVVLEGPDVTRIPVHVEGLYLLLLRIEATADKEGDSNLGSVGAGPGIIHSGGVAGFPLPVLRYLVAGDGAGPTAGRTSAGPQGFGFGPTPGGSLQFSWPQQPGTGIYRLEVRDAAGSLIRTTCPRRRPALACQRAHGGWRGSVAQPLDRAGGDADPRFPQRRTLNRRTNRTQHHSQGSGHEQHQPKDTRRRRSRSSLPHHCRHRHRRDARRAPRAVRRLLALAGRHRQQPHPRAVVHHRLSARRCPDSARHRH